MNEETKSDSLVKPLTAHKMEVLRLITAGDLNREIAKKLAITVSAVRDNKQHLGKGQNDNRRTPAVARARQLELLIQDG